MKRIAVWGLGLCLALLAWAPAFGQPIVSVGDYVAAPGDMLTVEINFDPGGASLDTFNFDFQITPPGAGLGLKEMGPPPSVAAGDAIPPGLGFFMSAAPGGPGEVKFFYSAFVTPPVPDLVPGVLATVDLGVAPTARVGDTWQLRLEDVAFFKGGDGMDVEVRNGSVSIVPLPGTVLLLGSGLVGLAGVSRRRFRK
ncbi:MAG: hypothetical protein Kow0092_39300 [Deferrisomatales bacterium]